MRLNPFISIEVTSRGRVTYLSLICQLSPLSLPYFKQKQQFSYKGHLSLILRVTCHLFIQQWRGLKGCK